MSKCVLVFLSKVGRTCRLEEKVTDTKAKLYNALSVILITLLSKQTYFPSLSGVCRRIQHTPISKIQPGEIFSTRKGTPR